MTHQKQPIYIIAEAGVNHNGSMDNAYQLIDVAIAAGANAVKFQSFNAEQLVTSKAKKADYQTINQNDGKSQLEMLKALELSHTQQQALFNYCQQHAIDFLSSPFDQQSAEFLTKKLELSTIKLGSGELSNAAMLTQIAHSGVDIILSTGMSDIKDIERALSILAFAYLHQGNPQSCKDYQDYWNKPQALQQLQQHVHLMHCTTEYPCPINEVNLSAMQFLRDTFSLNCGYSDHTQGIHISVAAAALGATIIEKHFTLSHSMPGPDHKASIEPLELKMLVQQVRDIEIAQGKAYKQISPSEAKNRYIARKGLYAAKSITKGTIFDAENLIVKRPEAQLNAFDYWDVIGQVATHDYQKDEAI